MKNMTAAQGLFLTGVSKSFGTYTALDDITLSVPSGELWTILGPSGCGKTTTLNIIAGFVYPDRGTIEINGRDILSQPPFKRGIGVVFQDYAIFPHMSVEKNIGYGLRMRRCSRQKIQESVGAAIDLVRLNGLENRMPSELSGGQRQRVALARSLAVEPSVLLLDEPLSNLDLKLRETVREEIVAIQRRLNITMVLVTHDQTEALTMSNGLVVMNDGHVEQVGTPTEVYENPKTAFVADFIGGMNLIPASSSAVKHWGALPHDNGAGKLGFRPSNGELLEDGDNQANDTKVVIAGHLERSAYLGGAWESYVKLPCGTVISLVCSQAPKSTAGSEVKVVVNADKCISFNKDGINNLYL